MLSLLLLLTPLLALCSCPLPLPSPTATLCSVPGSCQAILHPDTNEKIFMPFRMSGKLPGLSGSAQPELWSQLQDGPDQTYRPEEGTEPVTHLVTLAPVGPSWLNCVRTRPGSGSPMAPSGWVPSPTPHEGPPAMGKPWLLP